MNVKIVQLLTDKEVLEYFAKLIARTRLGQAPSEKERQEAFPFLRRFRNLAANFTSDDQLEFFKLIAVQETILVYNSRPKDDGWFHDYFAYLCSEESLGDDWSQLLLIELGGSPGLTRFIDSATVELIRARDWLGIYLPISSVNDLVSDAHKRLKELVYMQTIDVPISEDTRHIINLIRTFPETTAFTCDNLLDLREVLVTLGDSSFTRLLLEAALTSIRPFILESECYVLWHREKGQGDPFWFQEAFREKLNQTRKQFLNQTR